MSEPQVITEPQRAFDEVQRWRSAGKRVALVPTMGALHAGHLSLVDHAKARCDEVLVSIFVNPTQFGPNEDLDSYPRTWDADFAALERLGVAAIFAPEVATMYPHGASTRVQPGAVAEDLEGRCRPGHFVGVATIVLKLFHIMPVQLALFGRKDYQQCLVVRDMVRDLNVGTELEFCPTVRDSDGLALSSRNRHLSAAERVQARSISEGLRQARELVTAGMTDPQAVEQAMLQTMQDAGIERIDYAAVRDSETLQPLDTIKGRTVALIAARVGTTRLIDNEPLEGN